MSKKILFLTQYDETGASSRHVVYDYLKYFESAGFTCHTLPLIRGANVYKILNGLAGVKKVLPMLGILIRIFGFYLCRYAHVVSAWKYDAAVVQKDVLPIGLAPLLFLGQKNVVFQFDDPIWLGHSSSGIHVPLLGKFIAAYRKSLLLRMVRRSRMVLVDNEKMRQYVLKHNSNCEITGAGINISDYQVPQQNRELAFGWIGSPGTSHLLAELVPELEKLAKEIPFRLYNIGGSPLSAKNFTIENIGWSHENEVKYLQKFSIGLMPTGSAEFESFRASRKWLIYGCSEIPTLAPDTFMNRQFIEDKVDGLLYRENDGEDFRKMAKELLVDAGQRARLGKAIAKKIQGSYHEDAIGKRFVSFINQACFSGVPQ